MVLEELQEVGLESMDAEEIRAFLSNQRVAVLGLTNGGEPYLVPMSFGYDGTDRLYFTYLTGSSSEKARLTAASNRASVLVFSVDTMYNWQSVLLEGSIHELDRDRWDEVEGVLAGAWRPGIFDSTGDSLTVSIYEFQWDDCRGVTHQGIPPGFEDSSA